MQGRVKQSDAKEWLAPTYRSSENAAPKDTERVREVFRVARDLTLLDAENDDWVSSRELPATRRHLALHVHAHLRNLPATDPDAVLLRAYAWCAGFVEAHGTAKMVDMGSGDMAREISASLGRTAEADDDKAFNPTKLPAWKDWMVFLGLGWNELPGARGFVPDPSRRIAEELPTLTLGHQRMEGGDFMLAISKSLPYLDGGDLFTEACQTRGIHPPKGQVSRLLSDALRTLDELGFLKLIVEGDAKTGVGLYRDPLSNVHFFSHVEFPQGPLHV